MAIAVAVAHRPGSEEIVRRRPTEARVCCSPGCEGKPLAGGRFCGPHQERLNRIRAELDGEQRSGTNQRRWRERTTRGMKKTKAKEMTG